MMFNRLKRTVHICLLIVALEPSARSREMEPYAYAPNPVGANFFLTEYGEARGEILFDPALPITDVNASWHHVAIAYGRTFGLFGRTADFAIAAPCVTGDISDEVSENFTEITRTGFADPRIRFRVNLIGGPALSLQEFAKFKQKTTLGLAFIAGPPIGRYHSDKLVNIGSNR